MQGGVIVGTEKKYLVKMFKMIMETSLLVCCPHAVCLPRSSLSISQDSDIVTSEQLRHDLLDGALV